MAVGELYAGAKAGLQLVSIAQQAHKQGWLDKLATVWRKKHKILVLGSSGVGKTNFIESLTQMLPSAIDAMNRTEFCQKHSVKIAKTPFEFIDTPGQIPHKSRRLEAITQAITGCSGVINVVSYGYHEGRTGKQNAILPNGKISTDFLQRGRTLELTSLQEWTSLLGAAGTPTWLMTVVTKADLWWHLREEVLTHYQEGAYAKKLRDVQMMKPVVLEYCSVFHKFYREGALSGYFDEADRAQLKEHLLRQLLTAVAKQ